MAIVAEQCQRLMQEFLSRQPRDIANAPFDPLGMGQAFSELFRHMMTDPLTWWEKQCELWEDYVHLWQSSAQRIIGENTEPYIAPDPKDRRFKDEAWQENALFDFLKQSYLLSSRWLQRTMAEAGGMLDEHTAQKIEFYIRQFVDALSPSNFIATNPEVLKTTLETGGENLVKGLEHLLADMERGKITMTDWNAFKVGKNLAVTPGKVIYQNDLMQLIQYEPTTQEVYRVPLLIIPAWINKYYILDLQPENSLVKWLVGQGYSVFVISWVNPDERLSQKRFDDYMLEGPIAALDAIEQATGESEVSVGAYCLGGTLMAATMAYLTAKKQAHRVKSVTYLTTMVDFASAGDLSVFVDEEQLEALENKMAQSGYLDGRDMAFTFNMLRANDLIWSFVVNNYLLGKDPFPFDLLYWNADSTRMPAIMHSYYLRNMYLENNLVKPGKLNLAGVPIDLRTIKTPAYILSTREDHIAPWKSTYASTQIYSGEVRFVLAASGHIAGVVNPPSKNKYSYWVNEKLPKSPEEWLKGAKEIPGSWWPDWQEWHKRMIDGKVPARKIGVGKLKPIEDAPGSYVKVMSR